MYVCQLIYNTIIKENKNLVSIPKENLTENLRDIATAANMLYALATNSKSSEKEKHYKIDQSMRIINESINIINNYYNYMIQATQKSAFKVSGNTKSWTKNNIKLTVDLKNGGLTPKEYSFDNGQTWQKPESKTFTNSQTAYIKIKYDNNLESSVNIQKIKIDKNAPTVKFSISGTKYNGGYKSGAIISAVCTDTQSGITYMKTYDTQDTKDYRQYKSKATSSQTQQISLITPGNARNITVECKDATGNTTKVKSPSYKISY